MAQAEYDAFIESLRSWMEANDDDYNEFEDMMNELPDEGYDSIVKRSIILIPNFQRMVQKQAKSPQSIDISEIVEIAKREGLTQKFLAELDCTDENKDNFIPAMLSWLYFGRSWEGMVEHGEAILKRPNINWFQRFYVSFGIKMLMKSSISNGFRTQKDWDNYRELRKAVECDNVIDWAMEKEENSGMGRRATNAKPIIEFISDKFNQRQKQTISKMIAGYMGDNTVDVARHVATMITALEYHQYLKSYTKRSLYESLKSELNINIGSETLINDYLNPNNYDKNLKEVEIERAIECFTIKPTRKK